MDYSQITLNGKDWSNLYLVDYPGGAGGEMFVSMLSGMLNVGEFSKKKPKLNTIVHDSSGNCLASYEFPHYIKRAFDISFPYECVDVHQAAFIAKITSFIWDLSGGTYIFSEKIGNAMIDAHGVEYFIDKMIDIKIDKPIVIRGHHRNLEFEKLDKAKIMRLYPHSENDAKIVYTRMIILKWLSKYPFRIIKELPETLQEVATKNNGVLFAWEAENHFKNRNFSFHEFLNSVYSCVKSDVTKVPTYFDYDKNIINCHKWLFSGLDEKDKQLFEKNTNLKYAEPDDVLEWRNNNINFMNSNGIDVNKNYEDEKLKHICYQEYKRLYKEYVHS